MWGTKLRTLIGLVFWLLLALLAGARAMLDLLGYTTAPEDFEGLRKKLPQVLDWLFSTPWWVPAVSLLMLTLFMGWALLARRIDNHSKSAAAQREPAESQAIDARPVQNDNAPYITPGLKFFPSRTILEEEQSLAKEFADVEEVLAILLTGRVITSKNISIVSKINRLILPHPNSDSVNHYGVNLPERPDTRAHIIEATRVAQSVGIDVRWYWELIQHSTLIADPYKSRGWAHIELAPPLSFTDKRPSITIYKKHYEQTILDIAENFENLWDECSLPIPDILNGAPPTTTTHRL